MKPNSKVLIIAGSDSSGGAGIQADIKTVTALGSYAMTAITAVTVQNTTGVSSVVPISAKEVGRQIVDKTFGKSVGILDELSRFSPSARGLVQDFEYFEYF